MTAEPNIDVSRWLRVVLFFHFLDGAFSSDLADKFYAAVTVLNNSCTNFICIRERRESRRCNAISE